MRVSALRSVVAGAALLAACNGDGGDTTGVQPNAAPRAEFTFSCGGRTCAFTDRSSDRDAGGRVVSHAWDFGDGATSSDRHPVHAYVTEGTYQARLTVTDNGGKTGSVVQSVAVSVGSALTATFTANCTGTLCTFAPGPLAVSGDVFLWDFGDGTKTSTQAFHSYGATAPTTFTVTLTVFAWDDSAGFVVVAAGSKAVTVTPIPVVVAFTVTCSSLVCTFTDQSSGIPAGIASWQWDFGDGATSEFWNPIHIYDVAAPTTFTVTLTVRDFDGFDAAVSQQVTVTPAPPACGGPPDC